MSDHDQALAAAFDGQAERFEKSPLQSDPEPLDRLVKLSNLPADSRVLDLGCGPGLVASAYLRAGHRVFGVDLSAEMVERARHRCRKFGDKAEFHQGSLYDPLPAAPFDVVVSRYVLHHVTDPRAFVLRQAALVRPGGIVVVSDHTSDPDPARAAWHQRIEAARDRTHTRNLTPGEIVDLMALGGLGRISAVEESFQIDFDEWFDRGTPDLAKDEVRGLLLAGNSARGFAPELLPDGRLTIHSWRSIVRGVKPQSV
jgi:SAM-dependent methyltransferase